jgi:hypothetical protein
MGRVWQHAPIVPQAHAKGRLPDREPRQTAERGEKVEREGLAIVRSVHEAND